MGAENSRGKLTGLAAAIVCACLAMALAGCSSAGSTSASASSSSGDSSSPGASSGSSLSVGSMTVTVGGEAPEKADLKLDETISNDVDGEHAIAVDGESKSYSNTAVEKTGDSNGDDADFYGENASVFATNGATLTLDGVYVESDGTHANGVFSYGEGTTVNVSNSVIETNGNCSGGLMTTGGGTMNAENLRITTSGNSSAAIRSDRGGGTVNVTGGVYATGGKGSPVIYSTADITVNNAAMESTASQGVVVEGKNSVTLNDAVLVADNNTKNSDKSSFYQAVMIYQSMSGDAASGEASFTMNGGSMTNKNGDVFFVNNTVATISLSNATITNEDGDGVFLRAAAAGWGKEGSNGGQVTMKASGQTIDGDMIVDSVSHLNLYLADGSAFKGSINPEGADGDVYVELTDGSTWTLTSDAYISGLTCDADSINLNGHTLYVDGKAYTEGSASTGTAIEVTVTSSGHGGPDGASGGSGGPGGKPSGEAPSSSGSSAPSKPGN